MKFYKSIHSQSAGRGQFFADRIPEFVGWVEEDVRERFSRIRPLHVVADIGLNSDVIALPNEVSEIESIIIPQRHELNRVQFNELYRRAGTEYPQIYAQSGNSIYLTQAPSTVITAKITYWKKLVGLEADTDTNEILDRASSIYFHGILYHFYDWVRKDAEMKDHWSKYSGALEDMATSERNKRQSGPLRPSFTSFG